MIKGIQYDEALSRIKTLEERFNLNPDVAKHFEEGEIDYSFEYGPFGLTASINDRIFREDYPYVIKRFEAEFQGYRAYHAIETQSSVGTLMSVLYVGPDEERWPYERLNGEYIKAWIYNVDIPAQNGLFSIGIGCVPRGRALRLIA